jgi:putative heme degradation protein
MRLILAPYWMHMADQKVHGEEASRLCAENQTLIEKLREPDSKVEYVRAKLRQYANHGKEEAALVVHHPNPDWARLNDLKHAAAVFIHHHLSREAAAEFNAANEQDPAARGNIKRAFEVCCAWLTNKADSLTKESLSQVYYHGP